MNKTDLVGLNFIKYYFWLIMIFCFALVLLGIMIFFGIARPVDANYNYIVDTNYNYVIFCFLIPLPIIIGLNFLIKIINKKIEKIELSLQGLTVNTNYELDT